MHIYMCTHLFNHVLLNSLNPSHQCDRWGVLNEGIFNHVPSHFLWYPQPGCLEAHDTIDARAAEYQAAEKAAAAAHVAKEKAEEEVR